MGHVVVCTDAGLDDECARFLLLNLSLRSCNVGTIWTHEVTLASLQIAVQERASHSGPALRFTISNFLYNLMVMNVGENLDSAFSALADPTRRAILARLAKGEATVNELAEPFDITQPAISQHLKVLEDAGLIVRRVDGTKRPRRLVKARIEAMDRWLAMLRKAFEQNYDRLDHVLATLPPHQKGESR